jgi:hypothetical protein
MVLDEKLMIGFEDKSIFHKYFYCVNGLKCKYCLSVKSNYVREDYSAQ